MSSSGDSSYDDDDQDPRQSHRQNLINSNEIIANSEINKAKNPSDSSVNSMEIHNVKENVFFINFNNLIIKNKKRRRLVVIEIFKI
jgi:hypothetical protein